ncbi:MAG: hypothetical protein OEQ39_28265 [Gammaproteobacteria bacterium]|nr:hypothetical protein [Gammaproteobacteria bacterium]
MATRIRMRFQGAALVAALATGGPVGAEGAQPTTLDLRLPHEVGAGVSTRHPGCFLRQHCLESDSRHTIRAAPLTEMPRMSLPLGTYGPTKFNFNGSRVRMNVSF